MVQGRWFEIAGSRLLAPWLLVLAGMLDWRSVSGGQGLSMEERETPTSAGAVQGGGHKAWRPKQLLIVVLLIPDRSLRSNFTNPHLTCLGKVDIAGPVAEVLSLDAGLAVSLGLRAASPKGGNATSPQKSVY